MADQPDPTLSYLQRLAQLTKMSGNIAGNSGVSGAGSDLASALNIYNGIQRGGVTGYGGAALAGNQLYDNLSGTAASPLLSGLGSGLGIYNGIKQGGAQGDTTAALDAAQLYGTVGGALGAPGAGAVAGFASEAALPVAMLIGMNMLDQKQSQMSPETLMGNATRAANTSNSQANALQNGQSSVYGTSPGAAAEALRNNATADQAMSQMYSQMSPGQVNSNFGVDNAIQLPPGLNFGTPGGYGMGMVNGNGNIKRNARGGHMKSKASLKEIYEGSYADRLPHFDDGGSYLSYQDPIDISNPNLSYMGDNGQTGLSFNPNNIGTGVNPGTLANVQGGMNYTAPQGGASSGFLSPLLQSAGLSGLANSSSAQQMGALAAILGLMGHSNVPSPNWNPSPPSMFPSGSTPQPGAPNMWGNFTTTPRTQTHPNVNYATYGQGPEQSFFKPGKAAGGPVGYDMGGMVAPQPMGMQAPHPMPQLGGGMMGGAAPQGGQLQGTQGPAMSPQQMQFLMGNGPGAMSQANNPLAQQIGQQLQGHPQVQVGNTPPAPAPMARPGMPMHRPMGGLERLGAMGGAGGIRPMGHMMAQGGEYYPGTQSGNSHVQGPGNGTSDDINAKLSDGEYVMDAGTVSMLGNGSNKAGAAALDGLRERLRQHAGQSLSKGKQFMKAKDPAKYLGSK